MKTLVVKKDVQVGDVGYREGAVIHVEDERGSMLVGTYPDSFSDEAKVEIGKSKKEIKEKEA